MPTNEEMPDAEPLIEEVFTYHAPTEAQIARIGFVRGACKDAAATIIANAPAGPDRTAALRKLREVMMTANAAIMVPTRAVIGLGHSAIKRKSRP